MSHPDRASMPVTQTAVHGQMPVSSDTDFERRWREWQQRGRTQEAHTRRLLRICVMVAVPLAIAAGAAWQFAS